MRALAVLLTLSTLLAGCGAEGPPVPPEPREKAAAGPGVAVTGTARAGVAGGT